MIEIEAKTMLQDKINFYSKVLLEKDIVIYNILFIIFYKKIQKCMLYIFTAFQLIKWNMLFELVT